MGAGNGRIVDDDIGGLLAADDVLPVGQRDALFAEVQVSPDLSGVLDR